MVAWPEDVLSATVTAGFLRRFVSSSNFPDLYLLNFIHQWMFIDVLHVVIWSNEPGRGTCKQIELRNWSWNPITGPGVFIRDKR